MQFKISLMFVLILSIFVTACNSDSLENPCNDLDTNIEKNSCLFFLAIETGDYNYCTLIEGRIDQGSYPGDSCLERMSNELNSSEPCLKIKGYRKDDCIGLISSKLGDSNMCKDIEKESSRLHCIGSRTGNISVCETIVSEKETNVGASGLVRIGVKDSCIMGAIKQISDPILCGEYFRDGTIRGTCLSIFYGRENPPDSIIETIETKYPRIRYNTTKEKIFDMIDNAPTDTVECPRWGLYSRCPGLCVISSVTDLPDESRYTRLEQDSYSVIFYFVPIGKYTFYEDSYYTSEGMVEFAKRTNSLRFFGSAQPSKAFIDKHDVEVMSNFSCDLILGEKGFSGAPWKYEFKSFDMNDEEVYKGEK